MSEFSSGQHTGSCFFLFLFLFLFLIWVSESEGKKKYGKVEFQRGDRPGVRNQAYLILELTEKKKKREREREKMW